MEEDKFQEDLSLSEITIEEIVPGERKDRVPALTKLERMLRAYLEFLEVDLEEIALIPVGDDGENNHLVRLKLLVKPEALMDPEQKQIEAKFKEIVKGF